MNDEFNEQWKLYSIIEYISENLVGLMLFILTFFIVYFVDYINRINSMLFAPQLPIPIKAVPIKVKSKKFKK